MPIDTSNETANPNPLDRKVSWFSQTFRRHVTLPEIIGGFLSGAVGILIVWLLILMDQRGGSRAALTLAGLFPVLFVIQFSIHELGHLLVAFLVGLRIDRLKLGPLLWVAGKQKTQMQLVWPMRQPAGYVTASPTSDRFARLRMVLFIAAGSFANLCAGIACWLIASPINESAQFISASPFAIQSTNPAWIFPKNLAAGCFSASGLLALGIAFFSLIPLRLNGVTSDGAKLIDLFLRRDLTERNVVLSMLASQMGQGTRPRDWDQAMVDRLLAARTDAADNAPANLFAYYWAVDCGKIDEARQFLQLALSQFEGYPSDTRASLFLEGAYFAARHDSDVTAAFDWLANSREGYAEEQTRCRAEAALLLVRGKFAEARSQAEAGLKAIPNSKDLGGRMAEQEWLEDLLRQCPVT